MIITAERSCIDILDQLKLNPYMEINIISGKDHIQDHINLKIDTGLNDGRLDSFNIKMSDYSNYIWICPISTADFAETINKENNN